MSDRGWRDDVDDALAALPAAAGAGSSWIGLLFAEAKLQEASMLVSAGIKRINDTKSVANAKRSGLSFRSKRGESSHGG